jgi:hypothetical protein
LWITLWIRERRVVDECHSVTVTAGQPCRFTCFTMQLQLRVFHVKRLCATRMVRPWVKSTARVLEPKQYRRRIVRSCLSAAFRCGPDALRRVGVTDVAVVNVRRAYLWIPNGAVDILGIRDQVACG